MTIPEMHVWFRQYAQQMGMQNNRAILPEQIDLIINTSITDVLNEIIKNNITVTNDRVITDNSKIGQINALSTLYKVLTIDINLTTGMSPGDPFIQNRESHIQKLTAGFDYFIQGKQFNPMFLTNFDISYKSGESITNYFPIRVIDDIFLSDTLNDFILAPRIRTPIAVVNNNAIDVYTDNLEDDKLPLGLVPYKFRVSYIDRPAKVAYLQDITGDPKSNVDCDLPEYLHVDIMKHAVDLWRISVSGALHTQQQQEQTQQQDNVRNNYRNEGIR